MQSRCIFCGTMSPFYGNETSRKAIFAVLIFKYFYYGKRECKQARE
mgnify:FL=1|jgi:hypothetical protein